MILKSLVSCVIVVGLSGCSSFCDRAVPTFEKLNEKEAPCRSGGEPGFRLSEGTCEANLHFCSGDEQKKMSALMDCFDNVTACDPAKQQDFWDAINRCFADNDVSEECDRTLAAGY